MRPLFPARGKTFQHLALLLLATALLLGTSLVRMSLMPHDEGNYAAESRFMFNTGEWLARRWWNDITYSHGILLNWLMLVGYSLFGVSDRVARLPSVLACLSAVVLTYDIGKTLFASQPWGLGLDCDRFPRRLAFIAAFLLLVTSLWAQYGHLATQDMLLVSVELLGIWALLRAEQNRSGARLLFGFIAGLCFGLGYLVKTFMIFLPVLALLPYLFFQRKRHRHLSNPGLYAGLLAGIAAVALWIGLSIREYGREIVLGSMFGKLGELSGESFHPDGGPLYYLWNIPANMFPWALFALIGAVMVLRSSSFWSGFSMRGVSKAFTVTGPVYPHRWLLLYPFILAGLLTLFPTKTPYYTLQLHPFMAFFAAIALHRIAIQKKRWPRRWLSYSFAALGAIAAILALIALITPFVLTPTPELITEIAPYAPLALPLGIGWATLPVFMNRPGKWLATWILPAWLALSIAGLTGLLGNYSPEMKAALGDEPIASVIESYPVDFFLGADWKPEDHKNMILLSVYSPRIGRLNPPLDDVLPGTYAWASPNADPNPLDGRPFDTVTELDGWRLIRF